MELKIISINVWHGGVLMENLKEFIREHQPDILCVQEAYQTHRPFHILPVPRFHTISQIQETLDLPYVFFAPSRVMTNDLGSIPWGSAIFSRFPITAKEAPFYIGDYSEIPELFLDTTSWEQASRNLLHVTIQVGGKEIQVFNTHGVWGTHGGDTENRWEMSTFIAEKLKDLPYAMVMGDFNTSEHASCMEHLEQYVCNVGKGERTTSFNIKRKENPGYADAVVDMVYVTKDWEIVEYEFPQVDVSDHLPIVLQLRMPD